MNHIVAPVLLPHLGGHLFHVENTGLQLHEMVLDSRIQGICAISFIGWGGGPASTKPVGTADFIIPGIISYQVNWPSFGETGSAVGDSSNFQICTKKKRHLHVLLLPASYRLYIKIPPSTIVTRLLLLYIQIT